MKVAIIFSEGVKQINFTPENEDEKQALKLITPNDDIQLAVKNGSFGEERHKPFTIEVNQCKGGYLRAFDNSESIMLVLSPNPKINERVANAEQVAIEFTDSKLSKVNTLLSDDYKCGFKEGVQKYIENGGLS
jgi:hypothetical protein